MAQYGGGNDQSDLTFTADIQDNVSPKADEIEKRLKALGASKHEIKVFLQAYDQASAKIQAAQEKLKHLPRQQIINLNANTDSIDKAHKRLQSLRDAAKAPIEITLKAKNDIRDHFDNFKSKIPQMEMELRNAVRSAPLTAGLLGGTSAAYNVVSGPLQTMTGLPFTSLGAGAGVAGAGAAGAAFFQKSFNMNSQLEQQMAQLTQILHSPSRAQTAYNQVVQTSLQTPFNQPDVLQSYVQMSQMGTNPKNPAYGIKASANLAAGAQVPIAQATGALQAASLGYFEQFNTLTGRNIRQSDFTYGGRYSGQTYESAVLGVLKQYQNASETQMHTFKGLATNIQDTLTNLVVRPAGAPLFAAAKGVEQKAADYLGSTKFAEEAGRAVDKIQMGLAKVFDLVREGSTYFKNSLEAPLKQVTSAVSTLGQAFAKTFGAWVTTGVKYIAEGLTTIITPIAAIGKQLPVIGEVAGALKALHFLGISTNLGIKDFFGGIGSLNPLRMLTGIREGVSTLGKVSLFFLVKSILDMKNANEALGQSFKGVKDPGHDALDSLKVKFDALIVRANQLGKSVAQLKNYGAIVGEGLNPNIGAKKFSEAELAGSLDVAKLSYGTGLRGTATAQIFQKFEKALDETGAIRSGTSPTRAMDDVYMRLGHAADYASKALGISLKDATNAVSEGLDVFAKQLKETHTYGPMGAAKATTLTALLSRPGGMTAGDYKKFGSPEQLVQTLFDNAAAPGLEVLRGEGKNFMRDYSFKSMRPNEGSGWIRSHTNDAIGVLRSYERIPGQSQLGNEKIIDAYARMGNDPGAAKALGLTAASLPVFQNPLTLSTKKGGLGLDLDKLGLTSGGIKNMNPEQDRQAILALATAQNTLTTAIQNTNQQITNEQDDLQRMSLAAEKAGAAVAQFALSHEKQQHAIDLGNLALQQMSIQMNGVQRALAAQAQKMADYEHNSILPIQRAQEDWNQTMLRTSNALEDVSMKMQIAQFNMDKFNSGMLTGENALTSQIHSLQMYNEQLDLLRLQNMGLQADMTRTQFHNGFTSTVKPLMGFDLAREIQLGQERAQMKQDQYDITYGNQHWQLERAARPLFQRQEMSFAERMAGTFKARGTLDKGTLETMAIQIQQYHEQLHSRQLEEKMYAATVAERPMQDQQFEMNRKAFFMQQNISAKSDQIASATLKLAREQLPLQWAQTHIQNVNAIKGFLHDAHLIVLNERLGALQNLNQELNQIMGDLSANTNQNILVSSSKVFKEFPAIAKALGVSAIALDNISKGSGGGGLGGGGHMSMPPSGPGPIGSIKNIVGGLIDPRQWILTAGDVAKNLLGGGTIGNIASIAAMGGVGIAAANAIGIAGTHFTGMLGSRLATHGEHMMANEGEGFRAGFAKVRGYGYEKLGSTLSDLREGSPWRAIRHPSFILRTRIPEMLTQLLFTALGSLVGHPILGYAAGKYVSEAVVGKTLGRNTFEKNPANYYTDEQGRERYKAGTIIDGKNVGGRFATEEGKVEESLGKYKHGVILSGLWNFIRDPKGFMGGSKASASEKVAEDTKKAANAATKLLERFSSMDRPIPTVLLEGKRYAGALAAKIGTADAVVKLVSDTGLPWNVGGGSSSLSGANGETFKQGAADIKAAAKADLESAKGGIAGAIGNLRAAVGQRIAARQAAIAARKTAEAAHKSGEAAGKAEKAAKVGEDGAKAIGESGGTFRTVVGHFGGTIGRFGGFIGKLLGLGAIFDALPGNWQKALTKVAEDLGKLVVKPFEAAVKGFEAIPSLLGKLFDGLHIHIPKVIKEALGLAKKADGPVSRGLRMAGAVGRTIGRVGGPLLRTVGRVAGIASFVPAIGDLLQGKTGKAAQQAILASLGIAFPIESIAAFGLDAIIGKGTPNPRVQSAAQVPGLNTMSGLYSVRTGDNKQALGNIFASEFSLLEDHIKKTKYKSVQAQADDLRQLKKYQLDAIALQTQWAQLSQDEQKKYYSLSTDQQITAQEQLLRGPRGLKDYLDAISNAINTHHNDVLTSHADFFNKQNKSTQDGYQNIGTTQSGWLKALQKQIDDWEKSNGLKLTDSQKQGAAGTVASVTATIGGSVAAATSQAIPGIGITFAHGGLVREDAHKIGPGRVVRMVEEGHPEVVIPLAPHRRERAKSLLKSTQGLLGMAAGGTVTMYDDVKDGLKNIPRNAQAVASYVDNYGGYSQARSMFPNASVVSISVSPGNNVNADIYDVEPHGKSAGEAIAAILSGKARGAYGGASDLGIIKAAMNAHHRTRDSYKLWLSSWPGSGSNVTPGYDAHQYNAPGFGSPGSYDMSAALSSFFTNAPTTTTSKGKAAAPPKPTFTIPTLDYTEHGLSSNIQLLDQLSQSFFGSPAYLQKQVNKLLGMAAGGVVHSKMNKIGQIIKHGDRFATGGYVWPYGPGITSGRIDEGWDMAGSGPIAAIGDTGPLQQGQSGWPGTGQGFYYQLKNGIRAGQYVYVYENIQRLKPFGYQAKAGEVLANLLPAYPHLESGWSNSAGGPTSQGKYTEGVPQPEGYDFQRFLMGLAHGKLIGGGTAFGPGGTIKAIPPLHLKGPPGSLNNMGIVGPRAHAIYKHLRNHWQSQLNKKAQAQGGISSVGGSLSGPGNVWRVLTSSEDASSGSGWTELSPDGNAAAKLGIPHSFANDAAHFPDFASLGKMYPRGTMLKIKNEQTGRIATAPMTDVGDGSSFGPAIGITPALAAQLGGVPTSALISMADGSKMSLFKGMGTLVKAAGGIPRVSRDDTPALLHQDEMVLTAAQANIVRKKPTVDQILSTLHSDKNRIDSQNRVLGFDAGRLRQVETLMAMIKEMGKDIKDHKVHGKLAAEYLREMRYDMGILQTDTHKMYLNQISEGIKQSGPHAARLDHLLGKAIHREKGGSLGAAGDQASQEADNLVNILHNIRTQTTEHFNRPKSAADAKAFHKDKHELTTLHHSLTKAENTLISDKHHHKSKKVIHADEAKINSIKHHISKVTKDLQSHEATKVISSYHSLESDLVQDAHDTLELHVAQKDLTKLKHSIGKHHKPTKAQKTEIESLSKHVGALKHTVQHDNAKIKGEELNFIHQGEKHGISKSALEGAIRHVGDKDNLGIISDYLISQIPSALQKAGKASHFAHYTAPSSHSDGKHHHTTKGHHGHHGHGHSASSKAPTPHSTTTKHYGTMQTNAQHRIKMAQDAQKTRITKADTDTKHQTNIEKQFDAMVKHLSTISSKVQKLNPTVQNNIMVEVAGQPQKAVVTKPKPPRNR